MIHIQKPIKKGKQNKKLKEEVNKIISINKINLIRQDQVFQAFLQVKGITNAMILNPIS